MTGVQTCALPIYGNVRARARKVASTIRAFIEDGLADGSLSPGDKLPTETELMTRFGGGRNTIRKTLAALEAEGKITRQVGSGTFISNFPYGPGKDRQTSGLKEIVSDVSSLVGPAEVMELRLLFEPTLMETVTHRASQHDIEYMRHCLAMGREAKELRVFEHWDDELHKAIGRAGRNVMFEKIYEMISAVRNQAEWGVLKHRTLSDEQRQQHMQEHERIVEAIAERDALRARREMESHLEHVRRSMFANQTESAG